MLIPRNSRLPALSATLPGALCAGLLAASLLLAGCSTPVGKTRYPEASASYAPKTSHAVSADRLWETVLNTLERNRIAIASSDRGSGTLQTDYLEGQSSLIGLGLIAAQSTRYKYNVTVRPQTDGTTRLVVLCKVESTMKGGSGASQWTDVSGQNTELVRNLETWLYEQIEKEL